MSGGQISLPRLVVGEWMLVKDKKVAQCMTHELLPEKPNRNMTKSEMAQLEKKTN